MSDAVQERATATATTPHGDMEYLDTGEGPAVLFVHGSPGGCDQGALMTAFLVDAGFRVVAPSRPGYCGTALTDDNGTPGAQAAMELALMDGLGIDRFGLMCWSGGGPSSYLLAGEHPDRVSALVAIAAVSKAYTFKGGAEARMLEGRFGAWMIDQMARHTAKSLVKSTVGEEGDLSRAELKALVDEIWADDAKRSFVLSLAGMVSGDARTTGLHNDHAQFPQIDDLGLERIAVPTLLVHGTVDTDVPPEYSDHAGSRIPGVERLVVEQGTHIAVWTAHDADVVQRQVVDFLRR